MSGMPTPGVSVICPVYNEQDFIEAHIQNCLRFSDDIHYGDSGCTDTTPWLIRQYQRLHPGKIHSHGLQRFVREPYDWDEAKARNTLIEQCKHEWIVNLDADELMGKEFLSHLSDLEKIPKHFLRFEQRAFWWTTFTIRAAQWQKDWWRRFHPRGRQYRMFRNLPSIRYVGERNHAPLQFHGLGKWSPRLSMRDVPIPFYHYHMAKGIPKGRNDNRKEELNQDGIKLITYFSDHPAEVEWYRWWGEHNG